MLSRINVCALAAFLCALPMHQTHAALVISDIQFGDYSTEEPMIATSLSFRLTGTIEDMVGTSGKNILVVGEQGNSSWILTYVAGTWKSDETMTLPETADVNVDIVNGGTEGDRVMIGLTGGAFDFEPGQFISGTVTVTNGEFDHEATTPSSWVVSAGWNDFLFPDPSTITGSAAPEPASFVVLTLGMLIVSRRRRRLH